MAIAARRSLWRLSLSLSLAASVGCALQGAPTSSTTPSQPGEVAVAGTPAPPAAPQAEAPALPISVLRGKVTFRGEPMANATVRVMDALTDSPAGVIAAGGGNVIAAGGGNVIAAGGGNVIAAGGGNAVAPDGQNVIAAGGGNVIAAGGGNLVYVVGRQAGVIAAGGANVIAAGGGNVIAAGGGNVIAAGGGNVIAAGGGNLKTDAQGNFSLNVAGLGAGEAARIVVSSGTASLASVVRADGVLGGKSFRVLDAETGASALQFEVSEQTTVLSQLASGALRLTRVLDATTGEPIVAALLDKLNAGLKNLAQEFLRNPGFATEVAQATNAETGAPKADGAVRALVGNLNLTQALLTLNREAIVQVAQGVAGGHAASDQTSQQAALQNVPLVGTGLTATMGTGSLTLTTPAGQKVELPLSDPGQIATVAASSNLTQAFSPPSSGGSGGGSSTQSGPRLVTSYLLPADAFEVLASDLHGSTLNVSYRVAPTAGNEAGASMVATFNTSSTSSAPTAAVALGQPSDRYDLSTHDGETLWFAQAVPATVIKPMPGGTVTGDLDFAPTPAPTPPAPPLQSLSFRKPSPLPTLVPPDGARWATDGTKLYRYAASQWSEVTATGIESFSGFSNLRTGPSGTLYAKAIMSSSFGLLWVTPDASGVEFDPRGAVADNPLSNLYLDSSDTMWLTVPGATSTTVMRAETLPTTSTPPNWVSYTVPVAASAMPLLQARLGSLLWVLDPYTRQAFALDATVPYAANQGTPPPVQTLDLSSFLSAPVALYADAQFLYVVDGETRRIQKLQLPPVTQTGS